MIRFAAGDDFRYRDALNRTIIWSRSNSGEWFDPSTGATATDEQIQEALDKLAPHERELVRDGATIDPHWSKPAFNTAKVTRVEVIDHSPEGVGRAYSKWGFSQVQVELQDDGRTLKIFGR